MNSYASLELAVKTRVFDRALADTPALGIVFGTDESYNSQQIDPNFTPEGKQHEEWEDIAANTNDDT